MKKNIFIFVLLFVLLLSLTSCGKKIISLETDNVRVAVGEEYQIKPTCEKLKNPEFNLSLSNNNIEIVDEETYIIKGVTVGNTDVIISVKDNDKVTAVVLKVEVYYKDPTSINVQDNVTLKANETYTLSASVNPSNSNQAVTFKSLDESVVTVDDKGNVTPKNVGTCVVRVTSVANETIYKDVQVVVDYVPVSDIEVESNVTLELGNSYKLNVKVNPELSNQAVTYSSLDENIVSVDENGNVTAKNIGTCVVRVTSSVNESIYKDVTILVEYAEVTEIVVESNLTLELGASVKLNATVNPTNANQAVTYSSLDENIVSVDENGNVTAKNIGTCVVRVTSSVNESIYKDVTILVEYAEVTEIVVESNLTLELGASVKLNATVNPTNANQAVTYSSLDENIVSVDENGNVTAKNIGTCVVRVTSSVNASIYKDVTILVEYAEVTELVVESSITINLGDTVKLNVKVNPDNADSRVSFKSNDESVVKVDQNGNIKALAYGEANITVTSLANEAIYKTVKVVVEKPLATSIEVVNEIDLDVNGTYKLTYKVLPADALQELEIECEDGVIYKDGILTAVSAGSYKVTLRTKDGSKLESEIVVTIKGNSLPTFKLKEGAKLNTYLNWGKTFDPLADVDVIDEDEPNIASKVVIETELDNKSYGTYTVDYSVTDSDGNTATLSRTVEVIWNYDVEFIGHAGSFYGLMNSEEAILYAIQVLKYQCVEIDIKQSKDGVFILCHDDTFGGKTLSQTNWADLKDIEVTSSRNSGIPSQNGSVTNSPYTTKLCTLERFLEICKQYGVKAVIELKSSAGITNSDQSRMGALMKEIEKAGMLEDVIFLGSQYNCLIWTRNNGYDYIPCQYLVNSCESETYLNRCIQYNLDISINVTGSYTNSAEWLAKYKEAGCKISTYTYTQWVDYDVVQKWIDAGVDYVTCDWHLMDKLNLPESSNEPKQKFNVTFKDSDGTVLKVASVEQGRAAPAPTMNDKNGLQFMGWNLPINNIQSDLEVIAFYEPIVYSITYVSNASKVTASSWVSKDEFVTDFYNDLFNWIKDNASNISGLTVTNGTYKLTRNSTTVTFASASDIKASDIYDFEKTFSNLIYKPVTRNSDGTCTIVEDENYFLNSSKYRVKYQGIDQWLYNCIKTSYTAYDTTYKPTSAGKIQIFFRMHQWMAKGTNIPAFDKYPSKYEETVDERINPVLPTSITSYTVLDEIVLPAATGSVAFLGWYLDSACTIKYEKIEKGTTGNLVLYAKWDVE